MEPWRLRSCARFLCVGLIVGLLSYVVNRDSEGLVRGIVQRSMSQRCPSGRHVGSMGGITANLKGFAVFERKDLSEVNAKTQEFVTPQEILNRINISEADIETLKYIPQRHENGTMHPLWTDARKYRVTASDFSQAAGHHGRRDLVTWTKLWKWNTPSTGHGPEWGVRMEGRARNEYIEAKKKLVGNDLKVEEVGICIDPRYPWLSCSPDGIIHCPEDGKGLLEIKCPLRRMPKDGRIPKKHYDQIQGSMALIGAKWCDYTVWMPGRLQITRFNFDEEYWKEVLLPNLGNFYHNDLLPALVLKENDLLMSHSIHPHPDTIIPEFLIPQWKKDISENQGRKYGDRSNSEKGIVVEPLPPPRGKLLRRLRKAHSKPKSSQSGIGFSNKSRARKSIR